MRALTNNGKLLMLDGKVLKAPEIPLSYTENSAGGLTLAVGAAAPESIVAESASAQVKSVALIGVATEFSGLQMFTTRAQADAVFGEAATVSKISSQLGKMVRLALMNGATLVYAYAITSDTEATYTEALNAVFSQVHPDFCVIYSATKANQTALRDKVDAAVLAGNPCIGLCGMVSPTASELTARAGELNSEHMVLMGPGVYVEGSMVSTSGSMAAAALAGALCEAESPESINGYTLNGIDGLTDAYTNSALVALLDAGVTSIISMFSDNAGSNAVPQVVFTSSPQKTSRVDVEGVTVLDCTGVSVSPGELPLGAVAVDAKGRTIHGADSPLRVGTTSTVLSFGNNSELNTEGTLMIRCRPAGVSPVISEVTSFTRIFGTFWVGYPVYVSMGTQKVDITDYTDNIEIIEESVMQNDQGGTTFMFVVKALRTASGGLGSITLALKTA